MKKKTIFITFALCFLSSGAQKTLADTKTQNEMVNLLERVLRLPNRFETTSAKLQFEHQGRNYNRFDLLKLCWTSGRTDGKRTTATCQNVCEGKTKVHCFNAFMKTAMEMIDLTVDELTGKKALPTVLLGKLNSIPFLKNIPGLPRIDEINKLYTGYIVNTTEDLRQILKDIQNIIKDASVVLQ